MYRTAGLVISIAVALAAAAPLRAQPALDVRTVRQRIAQAAGPRPAAERIVADVACGSLRGTEIELRSGDDYRIDRTLGPFHTAHGSVGGVAWQQDENGQTVETLFDSERSAVERPDDANPATLAPAASPDGGYVISETDDAGRGTLEYVDAAWRVVREDVIAAAGRYTTTFDDFRRTGGYERPWHRVMTGPSPDDTQDYRIVSDAPAALTPGALAMPAARPLVEFPSGTTTVALPAQYDRNRERFIVRVQIGHRGLDFLLDTGASHIAIDRDVATELGLQQYGTFANAVNAGRYETTKALVPEMRIGSLAMHDVEIETIPHVADAPGPYRTVGLLGFDFFNGIGVRFDYAHGTATAVARSAIVPPAALGTIPLEVRLGSHQPETTVALNGARGDRFLLDTGGVGTVLIADHFRLRHPDAVAGAARSSSGLALYGLGGRFEAKLVRVREMRVADRPFSDFYAYLIDSPGAYAGNQDGLIGPDFLALFTVFADYPDRTIYLTPSDMGTVTIGRRLDAPPPTPAPLPTIDDFSLDPRQTPPPP